MVIDELPPRFDSVPIQMLSDVGRRTCKALRNSGFHQLSDLVGLSDSDLADQCDFSTAVAKRVIQGLDPYIDGAVDPTLSHAPDFETDLRFLLELASDPDPDRTVGLLEIHRGLRGDAPATLEETGEQYGITRERVRQLRNRAESAVRDLLQWSDSSVFNCARAFLARNDGLLTLTELALHVSREVDAASYSPDAYLRWIIEVASDPTIRLEMQTAVVGPPIGTRAWHRSLAEVAAILESERLVPIGKAEEVLLNNVPSVAASHSEHHAEVICGLLGVEILPGLFSTQRWGRAAWAELALEREGSPLHFEAVATRVNALSGRNYSPLGFNTVLNGDERFVRVGAGDFTLATWGAEPYGRFDEVVERYLGRQTVPVHEGEIVATLLEKYTVAPSTILAMLRLADEALTHFGGGYWGVSDKYYEPDHKLRTLAATAFRGTGGGGLTIPELRNKIKRIPASEWVPTSAELERLLYLSHLFRRVGTARPPKFRYVGSPVEVSPDPTESGERSEGLRAKLPSSDDRPGAQNDSQPPSSQLEQLENLLNEF